MEVVLVPSEACLGGHGRVDGIDDRTGDLQHLGHIAQESCAGSLARHFLDRTAEIDIYEIRVRLLYDTCSVRHRFGFAAVDLDSHRPLGVVDSEFAGGRSYVADQRVRVDKLRIDPIGSVAFAKRTKCRIGHILHGSQVERVAL